jgi:hypothetical protein
MDPLDFLDAPEGAEDTTTPAQIVEADTAPPEAVEAKPEAPEGGETAEPGPDDRPRDDKGRFANKSEPSQGNQQDVKVPLAVALRERDRRQAAEARVRELEEARKEQPQAPPDRYDDPEAYEAWREKQHDERFEAFGVQLINERLNFSERMARKEHGQELVAQAAQWAKERGPQDPVLRQQLANNPDPYEFIVQEYQRDRAAQALRDPATLEQFRQWQAAQSAGASPQPAAAAATPKPSTPPRSIIHTPGAGGAKPGEIPSGPGVAFDMTFKD